MSKTETDNDVETPTYTITHIDLRGHSQRQLGEVVDLTKEPEGFSEKWSLDYWKSEAKDWARTDRLMGRFADLVPQGMKDSVDAGLQRPTRCSECGKHFTFKRDGNTLVAITECEVPGGIPPYSVLINIPSGRIVMANDLRELTQVEGSFDVNTTKGQVALTRAYAEDGMAHIFTGNTCPGVYTKDGALVVGLGNDYEDDEGTEVSPSDPEIDHGSICTDLWWYSAMDKDLFEARCAEQGIDPKGLIEVEIAVEPGVYAFSDELADRDAEGFVALSHIRKVDEEAPKLRARKTGPADNLMDSHFWQEVSRLAKITRLFPKKDHVLADIFTVLGNGYDWHGNCIRNVSGRSEDAPFRMKLKAVASPRDASYVPEFKNFDIAIRAGNAGLYPTPWNYSTLGQAPLGADLYWLAAGMMFLKTVLAGEVKVITFPDETEEQAAKQSADLREVLVASLDALCAIAEKRGIDKDGTLAGIFEEIQQAW